MLSDLRQMTEECEKRENLSLCKMEDVSVIVLACKLHIMIRIILVFAVNLSLWVITCKLYNIEFFLVNRS